MRDPNTANYYALLIAILCNESAKEALKDMGVCPDNFDWGGYGNVYKTNYIRRSNDTRRSTENHQGRKASEDRRSRRACGSNRIFLTLYPLCNSLSGYA